MKKLSIVIAVLGILLMPSFAKASFFDDSGGRWYMNPSWWEPAISDLENRTSFVDQNNRLEWTTTPGWSDGYEADRSYVSKWAFDLNHDFEFAVGYHKEVYPNGRSGAVGFELGYSSPGWSGEDNEYLIALSAANRGYKGTGTIFYSEYGTPQTESNNWWNRSAADGILWARYDYSEDEIEVKALEKTGENLWETVGGSDHDGLRTNYGVDQLRLAFYGENHGDSMAGSEAYLQNFQVTSGTMVTPEPVSTILFLAGGTILAVRRLRRKDKKQV